MKYEKNRCGKMKCVLLVGPLTVRVLHNDPNNHIVQQLYLLLTIFQALHTYNLPGLPDGFVNIPEDPLSLHRLKC